MALPLELYHVLEDEYLSMYGPLNETPATYTREQILDERWARTILDACGIPQDGKSVEDVLNALVTGSESLAALAKSPALADHGVAMIDQDGDSTDAETRRRLVDEALLGAVGTLRDARLDTVYTAIHRRARDGKPRTALCISGGGVRSATFGLGIIQGMAGANLLDKFHYLSTVSGGGYMGSWLSSWVRRHAKGVTGVQDELKRADTAFSESQMAVKGLDNPSPLTPRTRPARKLFPEPKPLRHLRAYSSYLSPRLNVFSGDTWTMIALYLRNLLLNLVVLVPLLGLMLAFPRIFAWVLAFAGKQEAVVPPVAWAWTAAALVTWAFAYMGIKRPVRQGRDAKATETSDGWFIANAIVPLVGAATAAAIFYARAKQHPPLLTSPASEWAGLFALAGVTLVPFLLYYTRMFRTTAAERRAAFAQGSIHQWVQLVVEAFATVIAMGTSVALIFALARYVFPHPLADIPTVALLPPIERALHPATPMSSLYLCLVVPLLLLVLFVQGSVFVGLTGALDSDSDREWWGRGAAWLLLAGVGLAVFNAIAVFGPVAFYHAPYIIAGMGGTAGAIAAALGFSSKTSPKKKQEPSTGEKAAGISSAVMIPIFVVVILAAISAGTTWLAQKVDPNPLLVNPSEWKQQATLDAKFSGIERSTSGTTTLSSEAPRVSTPAVQAIAHLQAVKETTGVQVLLFIGLAAFAVVMSLFIGVNRFSLHAFYRARMIRGYLGGSRYDRDPDRFTGFDEHDNIQMWELRPELLWNSSVVKAKDLVAAMRDETQAIPNRLWKGLVQSTRDLLTRGVNDVSIEGLVINLNAILRDGGMAKMLCVEEPAWVKPAKGKLPYPIAIRNRATLDANFAQWITCMVPPADAEGAPSPVIGDDRLPEAKLGLSSDTPIPVPPTQLPQSRAPLHVLNGTLNLTTGEGLAWQERKGASFSMSPYHTGSFILGYRPSSEYGGPDGISLGTAATISGAAASPNMGYGSSPAMAFLLTLFNLRLGVWLGNPGPRGAKSYRRTNPRTGLIPLLEELTGNSNAKQAWVNLSDGGHFENLSLYEMVLRRCHEIVVSDGGHDPQCTFEDLANAILKIRIDFGIPIDIKSVKEMHPRSADKDGKPVPGSYVIEADIRYDAVDENAVPGRLTYIKPGFYDDPYLPVDVYHYALGSPTFPHESTADQFYSESQFESYRALARHAVNVICNNPRIPDPRGISSPVAYTYKSLTDFPAGEIRPPG